LADLSEPLASWIQASLTGFLRTGLGGVDMALDGVCDRDGDEKTFGSVRMVLKAARIVWLVSGHRPRLNDEGRKMMYGMMRELLL
jgi:hypothetical protein